jgi:DNA-binding CsgD family transcriptional regulator
MRTVNEGVREDRTLRVILAAVLVTTSVGGAIDLYLDAPDTLWSAHAIYEIALITAAMGMLLVLWRGWWGSRRSLAEAERVMAKHAAEREAWRVSAEAALAGFARAVDDRFGAWGLTPTERDIALRLLKGHSHKQIAFDTGRSERTVRQHAVSVYHKSGLGGRAELSAFFLEDLLLPAAHDASAAAVRIP